MCKAGTRGKMEREEKGNSEEKNTLVGGPGNKTTLFYEYKYLGEINCEKDVQKGVWNDFERVKSWN